jgi:hypothetical protein
MHEEEEPSYYEYDEEQEDGKSNSVLESQLIGDDLSSIPVLKNNHI